MQIVVNKDLSISVVEPSNVYQGGANADFLSVFAPFSITNYASVLLYATLPNGEAMTPRAAFATTVTPDGIGVWSMPIDSELTQYAGEIICQLAFMGAENAGNGEATVKTTDEFTINVLSGQAPFPPDVPSYDVYQSILAYLASIASGAGEGGGGGGVVIVQNTGNNPSVVMSQKAVTDALNTLGDNLSTDTTNKVNAVKAEAVGVPTYDATSRQLVFETLDGTDGLTVTLPEGSGGGGAFDVPLEILDDTDYSGSESFELVQISDTPRVYKARVLMYTQVYNCINDLSVYYYISNLGSLLNTHGITLERVSVSNNLLHSRSSMYNSSFDSPIPLPLGDEITFGQNGTGYYIRPTIIGGVNTYQNSWVSDWYVELELDIVNRLLLINAFQCDKKIGGN